MDGLWRRFIWAIKNILWWRRMRLQVKKPFLHTFLLIYLFISFICLYVKIVNRDCYSSYDSVNLITQQVETSRSKKPFQALPPLLLSSLRIVLSLMIFFRPLFFVVLVQSKIQFLVVISYWFWEKRHWNGPWWVFRWVSWYSRKEYRFCYGKLIGSLYKS